MRQLVAIVILLLAPIAFGQQTYLEELPSPETVFAEVRGDDESDTAARQLAAIDSLIELIKEKKPGGKFSGTLSPAAAQQLAAYNDAHRTLYSAQKTALSGDEGRSFYQAYLGYSGDKEYKLSVIQQFVPNEAPFMAGVYQLILSQQAQRGQDARQDVRDAEFAKFDEEYGETIVYAVFASLGVLSFLIAVRLTRMRVYSGELKLVGEGRKEMQYGITRRSVIEVGNTSIRGIAVPEVISSYMNTGEQIEMYVAPVYHAKVIYAVRPEDGRLVKMGVGQLVLSLVMKLVVSVPLLGFGYAVGANAGLMAAGVVAIYWGVRSVRAFSNYASIGKTPVPTAAS